MILDFFRLLKSVDTHVEKENSPNLLEKSSHSIFFLAMCFLREYHQCSNCYIFCNNINWRGG